MIELIAKPVTTSIQEQIKADAENFKAQRGRPPGLAVVLVGDHSSSVIYTQRKAQVAQKLGISSKTLSFTQDVSATELKKTIDQLNADPAIDGILIQRPLPSHLNEKEVVFWISPEKDVDAFHPLNIGKLSLGLPCFAPCTPAGILELLKFYQISISGKVACVIGRSSIVGRPMATLLLQHNATVVQCHSQTPDLRQFTRTADLIIVAAGKKHLINGSYLQKNSVIIDVGIHRDTDGRITGDVHYQDVVQKVSAITPVPGGVGPMTITLLMRNTIQAAVQRQF